jgi:hypothetical protein
MIPIGGDFHYQAPIMCFKNMDKIIKVINANPDYNINVFYSTPS